MQAVPAEGALGAWLERARADRDEALTAARRADAAAERGAAKAEALDGWRGEYQRRWRERLAGGAPAALLALGASFGDRLHEACAQQRRQHEAERERASAARERLLVCEQRVAVVEKLLERRAAAGALAEAKRDARSADEFALSTARRAALAAVAAKRARPTPHRDDGDA
jgi:flagellar export protein FliJ